MEGARSRLCPVSAPPICCSFLWKKYSVDRVRRRHRLDERSRHRLRQHSPMLICRGGNTRTKTATTRIWTQGQSARVRTQRAISVSTSSRAAAAAPRAVAASTPTGECVDLPAQIVAIFLTALGTRTRHQRDQERQLRQQDEHAAWQHAL